jgi:hypothetical protein
VPVTVAVPPLLIVRNSLFALTGVAPVLQFSGST